MGIWPIILRMKQLAAVLVVLLSLSVYAKDKYAPLPEKIMKARTVLILNRTPVPEISDKAYQELKKWGRFTVVEKIEDADLVLALTAQQTGERTVVLQLGNDTIKTDANATTYGNVATYGNNATYTGNTTGTATTTVSRAPRVPVTTYYGETTMYIIDPKTPEAPPLWSITRPWSSKGATKVCIRELRKRVEDH